MSTSAGYELTVVAGAMACGVILAFLYDLFRIKRRFVRTSAIFIHIEDLLFWLVAAIIVFLASYIISSGETRFYFFSGIFFGGFLYYALLSKIVMWTLTELEAVLWPVREILSLFDACCPAFSDEWENCWARPATAAIKPTHWG